MLEKIKQLREIDKAKKIFLATIPFIILLMLYSLASTLRHQDNANDKILPSISQMADAFYIKAFVKDRRTDQYILWQDTFASLKRLAGGIFFAAILGIIIALHIAMLPKLDMLLSPFLIFISMIPPLAILPIIFIAFGVNELVKIMLITIGIFPIITRDLVLTIQKMPKQLITKAKTLGATQAQIIYTIILPQVTPRLINVIRLSLGMGWMLLIAGEAIASTEGLGYRIFLVRRYLAMDVIIPYVLWITLLGFLIDKTLYWISKNKYHWYCKT
jgi:NitT/TauT family transport system permease protein